MVAKDVIGFTRVLLSWCAVACGGVWWLKVYCTVLYCIVLTG